MYCDCPIETIASASYAVASYGLHKTADRMRYSQTLVVVVSTPSGLMPCDCCCHIWVHVLLADLPQVLQPSVNLASPLVLYYAGMSYLDDQSMVSQMSYRS